jgi:dihydroflavonol-4-reductase
MKALVTGGTGFVGAHVVRTLVKKGYEVRALVRPTSRLDNLKSLPIETVFGDLRDQDSLRRALHGCHILYHVAADYRLWSPHPQDLYDSNVGGTQNILQAALDEKIGKVVYTSTVGAIGNIGDGTPGTENTPVSLEDMVGHYKRSKFMAEQKAIEFSKNGLFVTVVNPSAPVGSHDIKPTPTGKTILDFLNHKIPAYIDTGLNLIDVEDVAEGHWLAEQKGKSGERYILGNKNMTLKDILDMLSNITGIPSPKFKIPYPIALFAAYCDYGISGVLLRKEPRIPFEGVKMAKKKMFFDSSKAVRELGLPQTPVDVALKKAVNWFKENNYVKSKI